MENIASYRTAANIIKEHGFNIKKKYGQNFLTDPYVLEKILDGAEISRDDSVIEIGPGLGALTQGLSRRAKYVYAVEIDGTLCEILESTLSGCKNTKIVNADALRINWADLAECASAKGRVKAVANLPYYISTAVIMSLLESGANIDSITVMVQKEVSERLRAAPKSKGYGSLSVAAAYYADIRLVARVPRNCFYPRPGVDSEVVTLSVRKHPANVSNEGLMFKIIRAAFATRRKTLINCLFACGDFKLTKNELAEIIAGVPLSDNVRGEELGVYDFAALSELVGRALNV